MLTSRGPCQGQWSRARVFGDARVYLGLILSARRRLHHQSAIRLCLRMPLLWLLVFGEGVELETLRKEVASRVVGPGNLA